MYPSAPRGALAALALAIVLSLPGLARACAGTAVAGQSVTLSVTADGTAPFAFQWFKNGAAVGGATAANFTLAAVQAADAATYYALVSNAAGSSRSDDATLTVTAATTAPVFTSQPSGLTVQENATATFTAAASGNPAPTYQWCRNGTAITGATAATFVIAPATLASAGTYSVIATNSAGSVTSAGALLTVTAATTAPVFTSQPSGLTVQENATATFTAAATGNPAPTYQWCRNGTAISGATAATFVIAPVALASAGTYTVIATNSAGSVTSAGALLTVTAATTAKAPIFTIQPTSVTLPAYATATFTAAASGNPAPAYQWRRNGTAITGATSASLVVTRITLASAGTYSVVATNSAGTATSAGAVLTVTAAPSFTTQPTGRSVNVGATVTFSVVASGVPAPAYQWRKNGASIPGATGSSYTIAGVATTDAGTFSVMATNAMGSALSSGATLKVYVPPSFTVQPASRTVVAGAGVTFTAAATGSPAPTLQWRKDGKNISGATGGTYAIAAVGTSAAGSYTAVATNAGGSVTSAAATLTVTTVAPSFSVQPTSWTVKTSASVTFTAAATGAPAPAYQWLKSGIKITGATSASYTITGAAAASAGTYSVTATNVAGSATSTGAVLRVVTAASIVPADFNFDGHSDIAFENRVTGDRAVWLMNGTTRTAVAGIGIAGTSWSIAGAGDFNGDGNPDLFWQNRDTGECVVWLMNQTVLASTVSLGTASPGTVIAGVGDFDGDGRADIVWQDTATGACFLWTTTGGLQANPIALGTAAAGTGAGAWSVAAVGDIDGDGHPDIIWENTQTGARLLWLMNGTVPAGAVSLGVLGVEQSIVGTGDFNGDGSTDILLEDTLGQCSVWPMQGDRPMGTPVSIAAAGADGMIRN